jgi:hypothetical protein
MLANGEELKKQCFGTQSNDEPKHPWTGFSPPLNQTLVFMLKYLII